MSTVRGRRKNGGNRERKATGWNREWPRSVSIQAFASIPRIPLHPPSAVTTPLPASGCSSFSRAAASATATSADGGVTCAATSFFNHRTKGSFHAGPSVYSTAAYGLHRRPRGQPPSTTNCRLHYALFQVQYRPAFVPPSIATPACLRRL